MKSGDLYRCPLHNFLVYPTKEIASSSTVSAVGSEYSATYWSKYLDCYISYLSRGKLFIILTGLDGKRNAHGYYQIHILYGETVGWINWDPKWTYLEKVTNV